MNEEVAKEIVQELEKISNKNEKCLFVLGEEFSVNEIIGHLKKKTEIGAEFYNMNLAMREKQKKYGM